MNDKIRYETVVCLCLCPHSYRGWVKEGSDRRLLVDLWADMKTDDSHKHLWARDALHFSAEGYRHFASLIATQLVTSPVTAGRPWRKVAT